MIPSIPLVPRELTNQINLLEQCCSFLCSFLTYDRIMILFHRVTLNNQQYLLCQEFGTNKMFFKKPAKNNEILVCFFNIRVYIRRSRLAEGGRGYHKPLELLIFFGQQTQFIHQKKKKQGGTHSKNH